MQKKKPSQKAEFYYACYGVGNCVYGPFDLQTAIREVIDNEGLVDDDVGSILVFPESSVKKVKVPQKNYELE